MELSVWNKEFLIHFHLHRFKRIYVTCYVKKAFWFWSNDTQQDVPTKVVQLCQLWTWSFFQVSHCLKHCTSFALCAYKSFIIFPHQTGNFQALPQVTFLYTSYFMIHFTINIRQKADQLPLTLEVRVHWGKALARPQGDRIACYFNFLNTFFFQTTVWKCG